MGLLKWRGKKKKNPKKNPKNWRLFSGEHVQPTIVLHRGNTFPSAGSHFCFSYTELLFLNCCTLILSQQLPAVSFKCFWKHRDTSTCFRSVYLKKKKQKKNLNDLIAVFWYVGWSHILRFNMCPHSHCSLFFLLNKHRFLSICGVFSDLYNVIFAVVVWGFKTFKYTVL